MIVFTSVSHMWKIKLFLVTFSVFIKVMKCDKEKVLYLTGNIGSYGYPSEVHEVETEDGYILDVFRIPHNRKTNQTGPPVILMHGLMGSAEIFFLARNNSLPLYLSDQGYDVWLANARGTYHGRKHKTMNPDTDKEFWNFSFEEIGVYDLPATIDYVLQETNYKQVFYIGHSQGTSVFFVMGSERPEYNGKIKLMIAMSPSAFLKHTRNRFINMLCRNLPFLINLAESMQLNELPGLPKSLTTLAKLICEMNPAICQYITQLILGHNMESYDVVTLQLLLDSGTGGGSVKQALHYGQIVKSGIFRKYDYGLKKNLQIYNSTEPTGYNFQNIVSPIALFYGQEDLITTKEDVADLAKVLPNLVEAYAVPDKTFTHMDFMWSKSVIPIVYEHIVELFMKYDE